MKKLYFLIVVAVMAFMVSCNNESETTETQTQAKNPEEKVACEAMSPEMQAACLGQRLAIYGYQNESAEALIEAANILANLNLNKTEFKLKKTEGKDSEEDSNETYSFVATDLLAKAKEIAGEDAVLQAMIKTIEERLVAQASTGRGSTNGIRTYDERIKREGIDEYYIEFQAGEQAVCAIIGDGSTDLDLYIADEEMNLVAEDVDYTDNCYCSWVPEQTGVYLIRIHNRGNKANNYSMYIN